VEVQGKGMGNYARNCKASAINFEPRWINPGRGAANGCGSGFGSYAINTRGCAEAANVQLI
jgi:hypothetical protein